MTKKKITKKTAKAKTKKPVKKATSYNSRRQAALKAWRTIRAKKETKAQKEYAEPAQVAAPLQQDAQPKGSQVSNFTAAYAGLAKPEVPKKQKLVKGLIKEAPAADWEIKGQFGVSNINARGLTKEEITGVASVGSSKSVAFEPAVTVVPKPVKTPATGTFPSVAALLADASRWVKGSEAVDSVGNEIDPAHERAASFCLLGALNRVYGDQLEAYVAAEERLMKTINLYTNFGDDIESFNDNPKTNYEDVVRVARLAQV